MTIKTPWAKKWAAIPSLHKWFALLFTAATAVWAIYCMTRKTDDVWIGVVALLVYYALLYVVDRKILR